MDNLLQKTSLKKSAYLPEYYALVGLNSKQDFVQFGKTFRRESKKF